MNFLTSFFLSAGLVFSVSFASRASDSQEPVPPSVSLFKCFVFADGDYKELTLTSASTELTRTDSVHEGVNHSKFFGEFGEAKFELVFDSENGHYRPFKIKLTDTVTKVWTESILSPSEKWIQPNLHLPSLDGTSERKIFVSCTFP